jgi:hypothetical protein
MTETLKTLQILIENQRVITTQLGVLSRHVTQIENNLRSFSNRTINVVNTGLAECKEALKACQKGYHNIADFSEAMLEETEDLQNCLSTATVSTWC